MNPRVRVLYKIDARPDGPATARQIVARECSPRVSRRTLEDVELLVSELVTNRILHRDPGAGDTVILDLRMNSTLRCAVSDLGTSAGGRRRAAAGLESGRSIVRSESLGVVDRLAKRWGVQRTRTGGTRLWFETVAA